MRRGLVMSKTIGFFLAMLLIGTASLRASEGFDDLVKLVKSGIGEDVQIAFIDTSKVAPRPARSRPNNAASTAMTALMAPPPTSAMNILGR